MVAIVDWTKPEIRTRKNSKRREAHYPVTCPLCERVRWLNKPNARYAEQHEAPCKSCDSAEKGRKGYRETLRRGYTREFLLEKIAARPLNAGEQKVQEILGEIMPPTFKVRSQHILNGRWILDFGILHKGDIVAAIEVNGWAHRVYRKARDGELTQSLNVLFLDYEAVLDEPEQVAYAVARFLTEQESKCLKDNRIASSISAVS